MTASVTRLIRIANRLAKVEEGSVEVDHYLHAAIGRTGPVPAYTREEAAARSLLPDGFEWSDGPPTYADGAVYAACVRSGTDVYGLPYPHHGQWGLTLPLAMCGAAVRAWAKLVKARRRLP